MHIETFKYIDKKGWNIKEFPNMDSQNTLILTFSSPHYINQSTPFLELRKSYPQSIIAGCSTSGEIYQDEINDESISVAIIRFEKTDIRYATEHIKNNEHSYQAGEKIAKKLNNENLKAILIFSDGIVVNGSDLIEGIKKHVSHKVTITGGLAGDGKNFKQTWVLENEKPTPQCISAIGFYGDSLQFNFGSKGGWDSFGPERIITSSKGNTVYEIDSQPALSLYKKYLGERAVGLPATGLLFPLSISEKPNSQTQVVRTILSINEDEQSLTFAGDMPQGYYAQLMKANFDRLVEGAAIAGKSVIEKFLPKNKESITIAISCVGRRLILGERTEEEIDAVIGSIGNQSKLIGFYSYGEISPSGLSNCDLHNQTMTLTTITEK